MEKLVGDGIPARVLLPGTGCCAIPDTVRLTARALQLGVSGVLLLPPFYYKSVSDEGVFAAVSEVIEQVGDARLRIYLYHFPQMTAVPFSPALIERLRIRWPEIIAGMKDSSGDLANMTGNAARFPGFDVFTGSDEFLLPLLRAGGAGCITGVCNVAARSRRRRVVGLEGGGRGGSRDGADAPECCAPHLPRLSALRRAEGDAGGAPRPRPLAAVASAAAAASRRGGGDAAERTGPDRLRAGGGVVSMLAPAHWRQGG